MNKATKDRLILALDTHELDQSLKLIDELYEYVGMFKIGLQLFCNTGPSLLTKLQKEGISVFFDGKFMDIPNTVAKATEAIVSCGVSMFNVHAQGGSQMMKAACEASYNICQQKSLKEPIKLAVTVLTSLNAPLMREEFGIDGGVNNYVARLAKLAKDSGMDGVVASASEAALLRKELGEDFVLVTPGIRPVWASADDQSRIVSPKQAITNGADYLVVGRPITNAKNKIEAAKNILNEIEEALGS